MSLPARLKVAATDLEQAEARWPPGAGTTSPWGNPLDCMRRRAWSEHTHRRYIQQATRCVRDHQGHKARERPFTVWLLREDDRGDIIIIISRPGYFRRLNNKIAAPNILLFCHTLPRSGSASASQADHHYHHTHTAFAPADQSPSRRFHITQLVLNLLSAPHWSTGVCKANRDRPAWGQM